MSTIRDTEVEDVMNGYVRQIFDAVNLNPDNAEVVIVNDPSINAFVAGGQTIFAHTGLILNAKSADDVVFVLSHETGHILGGHVTRGYLEMQKAQKVSLVSTILGGLLAVASGHPDAGIAIMMGSQSSAMGNFMAYRQTEESSADRTAVDILKKTGYSMQGFENIMKSISTSERINSAEDGGYLRTHPISQTRVAEMKRFLENTNPPKPDHAFDMMKAKLTGFLKEPEQVKILYPSNTLPDKYANAIAAYRMQQPERAFSLLDQVISADPNNAYAHELKGQFYFEMGQVSPAIACYKRTISLRPDSSLMRLSLAQALLETKDKSHAGQALDNLIQATLFDRHLPLAWRLMATAYDRLKQPYMANYAMSEFYKSTGKIKEAQALAEKTLPHIPTNTPTAQKLQDILEIKEDKK